MNKDDLDGKYRLLRNELDEAYRAPVWDSERIDRIASEIIPVARQLASQRARGMHRGNDPAWVLFAARHGLLRDPDHRT